MFFDPPLSISLRQAGNEFHRIGITDHSVLFEAAGLSLDHETIGDAKFGLDLSLVLRNDSIFIAPNPEKASPRTENPDIENTNRHIESPALVHDVNDVHGSQTGGDMRPPRRTGDILEGGALSDDVMRRPSIVGGFGKGIRRTKQHISLFSLGASPVRAGIETPALDRTGEAKRDGRNRLDQVIAVGAASVTPVPDVDAT